MYQEAICLTQYSRHERPLQWGFLLARNFITILLSVTGSKVNHLQINGFKIDTENGQRKSIKFMFRFAGRKILQKRPLIMTVYGIITNQQRILRTSATNFVVNSTSKYALNGIK